MNAVDFYSCANCVHNIVCPDSKLDQLCENFLGPDELGQYLGPKDLRLIYQCKQQNKKYLDVLKSSQTTYFHK